MSHVYYMVFELHSKDSKNIGSMWREMFFDGPISSIKDINEAQNFIIDLCKNDDNFVSVKDAHIAKVSFYSLLRVEEDKKDLSKFEVAENE